MPFLTDAQRSALDAALAAKARAKEEAVAKGAVAGTHDPHASKKHGTVHVKPMHGAPGDRKSKQAKGTGTTKKGGAGGKFTWGNMLASTPDEESSALDKNDPNYDSEVDADVREVDIEGESDGEYEPVIRTRSKIVEAVMKYKEEIMTFLREYLESGDMVETARCIGELQLPQYDYYIVKRAITLAMDRKDREKEAISVLLSNMYGQYISPQQMQKGFVSILEGLDDLILDVPNAVEIMSLFICRAITDEILPPSFIGRLTPPPGSPLEDLKHKCQVLIDQRHCAERMMRCWGVDAKLEFSEARRSIIAMLKEYIISKDVPEVERQLRSLNAPFFHHEVVKQAILIMTDDMSHKDDLIELLEKLANSSEITSFQVYKGFQRMVDQLDDLTLDNPALREHFHTIYGDCVACGIIDAADQTILQESERRSVDGEAALHTHSVAEFKKHALVTIHEYFSSTDVNEVVQCLTERDEPGMLHIFVKQLLQAAMERTYRERELASLLLARLVPDTISREQLAMGLVRLLAACDDMALDIPECVHLLTLFIGRAIVDEILPPAFLNVSLDSLKNGTLSIVVVRNTGALLSSKHAAERLLNCWHGGLHTTEQLRSQMRLTVQEYMTTSDLSEVVRCLHDLAVPYYHHEFVRLVIEAIFEDPSKAALLTKLLAQLADSGDINQTQMAKGIQKVRSSIDDYALDYPLASKLLDDIVKDGEEHKWLLPQSEA